MAKKTKAKAAKKAPPKKPATKGKPDAKAKSAKPARGKAGKSKPGRGGEQLELIKGVRYSELDALCRQIGNHIDEINEGLRNKKLALQAAVAPMRKYNVTGYNYAGVTLNRSAGEEKITAKKDRGDGASAGGALNQPVEQVGSGQEAGAIADALTDPDDLPADTGE